jgi:hypothetical protein
MEGILSGNTPMTIGLAISLIGGVVWLTKMYALSKQNEKEIIKIWLEIEAIKKDNSVIIERMARIETKLDTVIEQLKKSP